MSLVQQAGLNTTERQAQVEQVLTRVAAEKVRYVQIAHPDLLGVLRGRTFSVDRLPDIFQEGVSFGARLLFCDVKGNVNTHTSLDDRYVYGNIFLLPDPGTFTVTPWLPDMSILLADPYLPTGEPAISTRLALQRATKRALAAGIHLQIGLEVECTITPHGNAPPLSPPYHLFSLPGQHHIAATVLPVWETLAQMGLGLDSYADEFGPNQIELNLTPATPLHAADTLVLLKLAARAILGHLGYDITFLAQVANNAKATTNGLHIHQSAYDAKGRNLFEDPDHTMGIAPSMRHYIGGQLGHARWCAVLSTPTITGYRRYRPGTWGPTQPTWSFDNRTSMVRVMTERGYNTRLENRLPDSAANPYLAIAALTEAGLLGLSQTLDPGPPITGNATTDSVTLPRNIWEAVACLEKSSPLMGLLGHDLIHSYRDMLQLMLNSFEAHVTDWELAEYRHVM